MASGPFLLKFVGLTIKLAGGKRGRSNKGYGNTDVKRRRGGRTGVRRYRKGTVNGG